MTHNLDEVSQVCLNARTMIAAVSDIHPVAHKIYGIPQTINSANYVYFLAYQELFALRSGIGIDQTAADTPGRLIPFRELDRIVTGESPQGRPGLKFSPSAIQPSFCLFTVDKALSYFGVTHYSVLLKKNTWRW